MAAGSTSPVAVIGSDPRGNAAGCRACAATPQPAPWIMLFRRNFNFNFLQCIAPSCYRRYGRVRRRDQSRPACSDW